MVEYNNFYISLSVSLSFRKNQKSHRDMSGESWGDGMFCWKSLNELCCVGWRIVRMMTSCVTSLSLLWLFASIRISLATVESQTVLFVDSLVFRSIFMLNYDLMVKENSKHGFDITLWLVFFWPGILLYFLLRWPSFLDVTVEPAFISTDFFSLLDWCSSLWVVKFGLVIVHIALLFILLCGYFPCLSCLFGGAYLCLYKCIYFRIVKNFIKCYCLLLIIIYKQQWIKQKL